jgi:molybdate transport system substrate-binding protein
MLKKLIILTLFSLSASGVFAQPVRVAVAANARYVVKKLAEDFKKRSGIAVEVISGSSGKLTAQIKNGAPYAIFLSADMDFAQTVFNDGFALAQPRVYALGSLIVGSTMGVDMKNWQQYISSQAPGKIAIANPKLAPYGKAAEQALRKLQLYDKAESRLVFGESISQVNTYVLKGAVNIGFTTASLVYELPAGSNFTWQKINPADYQPIKQGAVLLKYAKNKNYINNKRFFDYLFSTDAKSIFRKFGYTTL